MPSCQSKPFQTFLRDENKTFCELCSDREGTPHPKVRQFSRPSVQTPMATTESHQLAQRPCTCALTRRRLRNHCKTRVRGARLFLGHFLDQRDICPPVCPMPAGAAKGGKGPLHGLSGHLGLLWATLCRTSAPFPTTLAQPLTLWQKLATVRAEAVECCCCCWVAVPPSPYTDGSPCEECHPQSVRVSPPMSPPK